MPQRMGPRLRPLRNVATPKQRGLLIPRQAAPDNCRRRLLNRGRRHKLRGAPSAFGNGFVGLGHGPVKWH